MRSIVYHQFRKELHIIKTKSCISSLRKNFWYTPKGVMRYKGGVPPLTIYTHTAWWYAIAFAMDKKFDLSKQVEFFGPPGGIRTPCSHWSRNNPSKQIYCICPCILRSIQVRIVPRCTIKHFFRFQVFPEGIRPVSEYEGLPRAALSLQPTKNNAFHQPRAG